SKPSAASRGKPGRVADIHRISLKKMAGYHLDISCQVPLALVVFSCEQRQITRPSNWCEWLCGPIDTSTPKGHWFGLKTSVMECIHIRDQVRNIFRRQLGPRH